MSSITEQDLIFEPFNQVLSDTGNTEDQMAEPKAMTDEQAQFQPQKLSRHQKKKKGEYLKRLSEENQQLRNLIIELEKKISTKEAENSLLQSQLTFFKQQLPGGQN